MSYTVAYRLVAAIQHFLTPSVTLRPTIDETCTG